MSFRSRTRKAVTATAVGLAALVGKAESQVVSYVHQAEDDASRVRTDLFYGLPGGIHGYTFIELYNNGYFSGTMLSRPIRLGIGPNATIYNMSDTNDMLGVGAQKNFSVGDRNFLNVGILPYFFDSNGVLDKQVFTAAWGFTLPGPRNPRFEGFTYTNIDGTHDYGELYLLVDAIGKTQAGLHIDLLPKNSPAPKARVGAEIRMPLK